MRQKARLRPVGVSARGLSGSRWGRSRPRLSGRCWPRPASPRSRHDATWAGSSGWSSVVAERISIEADGADAARRALERCVAGGGVAVFPADGLYGLACDPLDPAAIARIQRLKGRDDRKPSAVMYFTVLAMRELLDGVGPLAGRAMGKLLPGPV